MNSTNTSDMEKAGRINISSGGAYEKIYGYSRAVRVGDTVHVSGTCAPPECQEADAYTQACAALKIIEKALKEAGASFTDVVRTVVYIMDMADVDDVAKAHSEVFGKIRPASTLIRVSSALRQWQRVEIETYAICR